MKRKIEKKLLAWKNKSTDRKPLIINGARQVGKTHTLRQFGREEYENTIYVNLETNSRIASLFDDDITPERLIRYLEGIYGEKINKKTTLVIFDEIQSCERAVSSLKYFCEEAPEYHVAAAGSLLGVSINRTAFSFPVGKVETLQLYPLDFEEFLDAMGEASLKGFIRNAFLQMSPLTDALHAKAVELYRDYLIVGGMPAAVNAYRSSGSYIDAAVIQGEILNNYVADMTKYASNAQTVKIRACYQSIPAQLGKENKKFQYKVVKKGGSASLFGESIDWLKQAGTVIECRRTSEGNEPLAAYADLSAFKLYLSDVGLLVNMSGMSYQTILIGESNGFMGAVTENYVAQQLTAKGYPIFYWSRENSQAELDFIIQRQNHVYGIEVKKGEKVKSRSLAMFTGKYPQAQGFRLSLKNFGSTDKITAVPLYSLFCL